jgi:hypothetical protein
MILAWGLALAVDWAREKRFSARLALGLFIFLALAEQAATFQVYDVKNVNHQVNQIAQKIPEGCSSFILIPPPDAASWPDSHLYHLDAMWAGVQRRVPTLNGYSGASPVAYPLLNFFKDDRRRQDIAEQIETLSSNSGLTEAPCRVEFQGRLGFFGQPHPP